MRPNGLQQTKGHFPELLNFFLKAALKQHNFIPGNENRHSSDKHKNTSVFPDTSYKTESVSVNTYICEEKC